jgi:hypothetical protein
MINYQRSRITAPLRGQFLVKNQTIMKPINKIIFPILLFSILFSFSSCKTCEETNTCPCEQTNTCGCTFAEEITDLSYFQTNRTLSNICPDGVDYIIATDDIYEVTAALTLEAGVSIQFVDGAGLSIEETGSINAIGNGTSPILLQGTNGNAVGSWRGIIIYSDKTANALNYVTIKGAGSDEFNSNGERGSLVVYADSKVSIDNCTFENSAAYGLNSNYSSAEITSLMNNKFINNDIPILIRANNADIIDATNSFSGNTNAYVHTRIGSIITTDKTWQALSIPYQIASADFGILKLQRVESNGKLSINAGASIWFETQTGIFIDDTAIFSAIGTASDKITFRGVDPQASSWDGIQFYFTQSPSNEIRHAIIEHAGSDQGAIYLWANPALKVSDVTFNDISSCAFYDGPKGASDPANPNLARTNITYNNVTSQYCQGN